MTTSILQRSHTSHVLPEAIPKKSSTARRSGETLVRGIHHTQLTICGRPTKLQVQHCRPHPHLLRAAASAWSWADFHAQTSFPRSCPPERRSRSARQTALRDYEPIKKQDGGCRIVSAVIAATRPAGICAGAASLPASCTASSGRARGPAGRAGPGSLASSDCLCPLRARAHLLAAWGTLGDAPWASRASRARHLRRGTFCPHGPPWRGAAQPATRASARQPGPAPPPRLAARAQCDRADLSLQTTCADLTGLA